MSRAENKAVMGYFPIEARHHAAILSLIGPATTATRMLDPFAGDGLFLEVAAKAWKLTPYANELDGERAQQCIERFGPKHAVRCDAERLQASLGAFGVGWFNPPYDFDKTAANGKRVEFRLLRHAWKWIQPDGIVFWVVYQHHITEKAAAFLSKHSTSVDVWALPGKHLNAYDQVVLVARVARHPEENEALYQKILAERVTPPILTIQPGPPLYELPPPPDPGKRFVFAADIVDEAQGLRLIEEQGAHKSNGFQALLEVPPTSETIEPIVPPRPGHLALVLAAGVANGAVLETAQHGTVALRSKIVHVEEVARVEVEGHPDNPEQQVKKTYLRLKPTTTLTLLAHDGTVVEMAGDEALLDFIKTNRRRLVSYLNRRFKPLYAFDFNGLHRFLDRIRLKGKHTLYTAQKHVVAAITCGFEHRDSLLLVGQMGCGKTALGGSTAISIATGVVRALRNSVRDDQVILVVCPPHLIEKWQRELLSISANVYVEKLARHEEVKAFMDQAARLGPGIAKIGLIKRDMTKLGSGREMAVNWRNEPVTLWRHDQPTPTGYDGQPRVVKNRIPKCPECGSTVYREQGDSLIAATESWLASGKRRCPTCNAPLWQEARDRGSRPKPGHKFPPKNPRYPIADYIQRRYSDRVYLLIWDEIHEAQAGDTGNGAAFARLAGVARKVLALTGTPFNGKASSMLNIEYALNPRVRQRYSWGPGGQERGQAESRWVANMGVRERVLEDRPTYDSTTGQYTGRSTYERPYEEVRRTTA